MNELINDRIKIYIYDDAIQGEPKKTRNGIYFPQSAVDAIPGIIVWGKYPEKNDTKISNIGSVLFSRTHFVRQFHDPKFSLFSWN